MNINKWIGVITAVIGIGMLIGMLNSGMPTPVLKQPIEAYLGIAFSIGWLTGVPAWLAYVLAALVVVLLATVLYKLGSWVSRLLFK